MLELSPIDRSLWRHFDKSLFLAVLLLCGIGIAMIYSATITTIDLTNYWQRQLIFTILGAIAQIGRAHV